MTFPLIAQEKALEALADHLPASVGVVVIFLADAPEHGPGVAVLSMLATVPPDMAYKALLEIVARHLRGESPEPMEARVQ